MASKVEEKFLKDIKDVINSLEEIWDDIGFNDKEKKEKQESFLDQINESSSLFYHREKKLKNSMVKQVETNGQQVYTLTKVLGLADDSYNVQDSTLLQMDAYLKDKIVYLNELVKERKTHLEKLQLQEQELCEILHEDPVDLQYDIIPSQDQLEKIQENIIVLEQERIHRELQFNKLKSQIIVMMEELEMSPRSSFEVAVVGEVKDMVTLSQRNIKKIRELNEELSSKIQENDRLVADLMVKITALYDRLNVEEDERNDFINLLPDHVPSRIKVLQEEEDRLKTIRQENLEAYTKKIRNEVIDWWHKCYISDQWKEKFESFFSDEYSEEIIDCLENELERLKVYHTKVEPIFAKLEKRQQLWMKAMELNDRANDPNRLFGNRGCSLLKEEKERKRVNNELPKIEMELEDLVTAHEVKNSSKFQINGLTVTEYIERQWNEYNERKEQEKLSRMELKSKRLKLESQLGTQNTKAINKNTTLKKANKTRLNENSRPSTSKYNSTSISRRNVYKTSSLAPVNETKAMQRFSPYRSVLREQNRNTPGRCTSSSRKGSTTSGSSDMSTYSEFSADLNRRSERDHVRSSVAGGSRTPIFVYKTPERIDNTPSRGETPVSIPVTLPRIKPTRRSPRLNGSKGTIIKSPHHRSSKMWGSRRSSRTTHLATPTRNRLNFLI